MQAPSPPGDLYLQLAGIVGVRNFQNGVWSDTVNTASRMESSGEVGQVIISEAT